MNVLSFSVVVVVMRVLLSPYSCIDIVSVVISISLLLVEITVDYDNLSNWLAICINYLD